MTTKTMLCLSCTLLGVLSLQTAFAAPPDTKQLQESVKKAATTPLNENANSKVLGKNLTLMDAVKIALVSSPAILTQKLATDSAAAAVRIEKGAFDLITHTTLSGGRKADPLITYDRGVYEDLPYLSRGEINWVAGLTKNTRSGISGDFSVNIYRKDPINYDRDHITTSSQSQVEFKLNIPLLQGRGSTSAAAAENAAQLNYEASTLELRHAIAVTVYQVVVAYWDYKTAVEFLKLQEGSEKRVKNWLDTAEAKLQSSGKSEEIEKQHEAEISGLIAYEADKKLATMIAREQLRQAQDNLALALGVPFDQFEKIGIPSDDFSKDIMNINVNDPELLTRWSTLALDGRLDLQAAKLRQQAAQVMLAKARRDVLPKLDLQLSVGYSGSAEGADFSPFHRSLKEQIHGPSTSAGLSFMYPIGNNTARGILDQSQADYQQNVIQTNELARTIKSQIHLNVAALQRQAKAADMAERAVKFYQPSLDALQRQIKEADASERTGKGKAQDASKSQSLGNISVVTGLTDIEEKLTAALITRLTTQAELAKAIVATRLNTGTLLSLKQETHQLSVKELSTLP